MRDIVIKVNAHVISFGLIQLIGEILPQIGWQTTTTDRFCTIRDLSVYVLK